MAYFFALASTAHISGAQIGAQIPVKTGHNGPSILIFNRIHCKYKLYTYICHFSDVQKTWPARLCPSGLYFLPASTGTDHATGIHQLGWGYRKLGIACPLFAFFMRYVVNIS